MKEEEINLFLYGIFLNVSVDVNDKNEKDWTDVYCFFYDGKQLIDIFLDETKH